MAAATSRGRLRRPWVDVRRVNSPTSVTATTAPTRSPSVSGRLPPRPWLGRRWRARCRGIDGMQLNRRRTGGQPIGAHPGRLRTSSGIHTETAPPVRRQRRSRHQRDRIPVDVAAGGDELLIGDDLDRVESTTIEGAVSPVPAVVPLRVLALERLHRIGQPSVRTVDEQMEMVGHEAPGVDLDSTDLRGLRQQVLEPPEVAVVSEDVLSVGSSIHHVVPGAGNVGSSLSCHVFDRERTV